MAWGDHLCGLGFVDPRSRRRLNPTIWAIYYTLPESNIAPENGWLEDEFPLGMAYFQVLLLLVSGRVT